MVSWIFLYRPAFVSFSHSHVIGLGFRAVFHPLTYGMRVVVLSQSSEEATEGDLDKYRRMAFGTLSCG